LSHLVRNSFCVDAVAHSDWFCVTHAGETPLQAIILQALVASRPYSVTLQGKTLISWFPTWICKKEKLFQDMTSSSSSKKLVPDQPEISGSTPKSLRTKMIKTEDSEKRVMVLCSIQIWKITHFLNHQNKCYPEAQKMFLKIF
jgi:hypothetical protein